MAKKNNPKSQRINIKNKRASFDYEFIDIFNAEINNFFLFIFLLKKGLYDEKSYKSAVDINEDYI